MEVRWREKRRAPEKAADRGTPGAEKLEASQIRPRILGVSRRNNREKQNRSKRGAWAATIAE